jgi:glycosyltransferase involved in cell wall biosynthesis
VTDKCHVRNVRFGKTTILPTSRLHFVIAALIFQLTIFLWVVMQIGEAGSVVLHAHDFNTLPGCAATKRLFKQQTRLIYDSHELTPGAYAEWYGGAISAIVTRIELAALRQVDGIVAANSAILAHLCSASQVPATTIYNCVPKGDVPNISRTRAKEKLGLKNYFVIYFPGKARQDYDLDLMFHAARFLRENKGFSVKFVFTGHQETMVPLVKTVGAEHLEDFFDFRGWVTDQELLLYYTATDLCFAVTSDIGLNTKILTPIRLFESMACGVPVVVRDGTLAARIVRQWGCGLIVDNQPTSFSRELVELSRNREKSRALGEAGHRAFTDEFNWNLMQNRLLQLYSQLSFPIPKS